MPGIDDPLVDASMLVGMNGVPFTMAEKVFTCGSGSLGVFLQAVRKITKK
jgi:hypothetical protein